MFEDSLVESRVGQISSSKRWTTLASIGLQVAVAGVVWGDGHGPVVSVAPATAPAALIHVSTGVLQGMLLAPIRPVYPVIAKAAGVQGTVVVEAVISRKGTIESLRVM